MLFGGTLLTESDEEHAGVETVGSGLADEVVCHLIFILGPVVLDLQLLQPLASCERCFDSCVSSSKVVLGLVKDRIGDEDVQDSLVPLQDFFCEEEFGQLIDIEVGLCSFLGEQLGTLRPGGLEGLDPFWIGRHDE